MNSLVCVLLMISLHRSWILYFQNPSEISQCLVNLNPLFLLETHDHFLSPCLWILFDGAPEVCHYLLCLLNQTQKCFPVGGLLPSRLLKPCSLGSYFDSRFDCVCDGDAHGDDIYDVCGGDHGDGGGHVGHVISCCDVIGALHCGISRSRPMILQERSDVSRDPSLHWRSLLTHCRRRMLFLCSVEQSGRTGASPGTLSL